MALIARKPTALNVDATYWRIPSYQYNIDGKEFSCVLQGHIDEGSYLKNARPLVAMDFIVRFENNGKEQYTAIYLGSEPMVMSGTFIFPAEIDRIYLYELLKNNVPYFCGAENG